MLAAQKAIYHATQSIIGTAIITAYVGAVILFVLFVKNLVKFINNNIGIKNRLRLLNQFCQNNSMKVNRCKSKFFFY